MSETPKTDAVQGGLECATERPEDWEKCFQWMAGHARSLQRELEATKRLLNFWKSAFHESRVVARVEDTPITDAAVVLFTVASEIDRSPAGEWVAAGVARGLEQERNAVLADIRNADAQLMRWFEAASPYATPGSLEEGLKRLDQELFYAAITELLRRIEACGASVELTHAVTLCADLLSAIGNQWNQPDEYAEQRVRDTLNVGR
jgi:hypothetical protein